MAESDIPLEAEWEVGWEGHERAQLLRMANVSLRQKLLWLEEAQEIVRYMQSRRQLLPSAQPGVEQTKPEEAHE